MITNVYYFMHYNDGVIDFCNTNAVENVDCSTSGKIIGQIFVQAKTRNMTRYVV